MDSQPGGQVKHGTVQSQDYTQVVGHEMEGYYSLLIFGILKLELTPGFLSSSSLYAHAGECRCREVARRVQLPLRLAWALSVHKSQVRKGLLQPSFWVLGSLHVAIRHTAKLTKQRSCTTYRICTLFRWRFVVISFLYLKQHTISVSNSQVTA